ncbi:MAG: glycosyltransferase family 2 protein [Anaerolineales bacterium]|nr:glycosyltransferase family 2 protein [Anaerolineales bacterium]
MLASVIIPTYNRPDTVLRLLDSLVEQTLAPEAFEVIVVDDGSEYDPTIITERAFPFALHYMRQPNSGATIARNNGAQKSQGDVLVVIDDDVTVTPPVLEALTSLCCREEGVVVMGTLITRSVTEPPTPFLSCALEEVNNLAHAGGAASEDKELSFAWCNTQLLAVRRSDFFALGMLQDPTGGWPNWDDVDFGYRSHLAGLRLLQSSQAVGYHWDNSLRSLAATCNRWQRACKSAVRLFETHPGLQPHIPMLHDKTPVAWSQDSPKLIVRKFVRQVLAWPFVLRGMERLVEQLEKDFPKHKSLLNRLYTWIQGSYMVLGYREGLQTAV